MTHSRSKVKSYEAVTSAFVPAMAVILNVYYPGGYSTLSISLDSNFNRPDTSSKLRFVVRPSE